METTKKENSMGARTLAHPVKSLQHRAYPGPFE